MRRNWWKFIDTTRKNFEKRMNGTNSRRRIVRSNHALGELQKEQFEVSFFVLAKFCIPL